MTLNDYTEEKYDLKKVIQLEKLEMKTLGDSLVPINLWTELLKQKLSGIGIPDDAFITEFTFNEINELMAYPYRSFFNFTEAPKTTRRTYLDIINKNKVDLINEEIDEKVIIKNFALSRFSKIKSTIFTEIANACDTLIELEDILRGYYISAWCSRYAIKYILKFILDNLKNEFLTCETLYEFFNCLEQVIHKISHIELIETHQKLLSISTIPIKGWTYSNSIDIANELNNYINIITAIKENNPEAIYDLMYLNIAKHYKDNLDVYYKMDKTY